MVVFALDVARAVCRPQPAVLERDADLGGECKMALPNALRFPRRDSPAQRPPARSRPAPAVKPVRDVTLSRPSVQPPARARAGTARRRTLPCPRRRRSRPQNRRVRTRQESTAPAQDSRARPGTPPTVVHRDAGCDRRRRRRRPGRNRARLERRPFRCVRRPRPAAQDVERARASPAIGATMPAGDVPAAEPLLDRGPAARASRGCRIGRTTGRTSAASDVGSRGARSTWSCPT